MTIETGGASAPADVTSAAPIETVAAPPAPLSDAPLPGAPPEVPEAPKPVPTTREALKAAAAKVEAGEGDPKDLKKGAQLERGEGGKFAAKPAEPGKDAKPGEQGADKGKDPAASVPAAGVKPNVDANAKPADGTVTEKPAAAAVDPNAKPSTAPARFSPDAKAVWDTAPEPVKAEVARMERELTAGIEKHRVQAEKYEPIKPYEKMATDAGTTVHAALKNYTDLDKLMHTNPLKGLEEICHRSGVSLRDVARIVLGEPVEHQQSQQDATIRDLKNNVARLEQALGSVTQRFQQQDEGSVMEHIQTFAADKPLFEVLAPHIATAMREEGLELADAYEAVLQKHPQLAAMATTTTAKADPPVPPAVSPAAAPDLDAQTIRANKSITGAPGGGSEPVAQRPSSSIKEALKRAAARAG